MNRKGPVSPRMQRQFEKAGCRFEREWTEFQIWMHPVYGPDGGYVGDANHGAHFRWLARNGMVPPLLARPDDRCSSVAKVTKGEHAGKWVGFSHRASCPFGVDDMLFDPEAWDKAHPDEDGNTCRFVDRGVQRITTDAEARESAARFAGEVA